MIFFFCQERVKMSLDKVIYQEKLDFDFIQSQCYKNQSYVIIALIKTMYFFIQSPFCNLKLIFAIFLIAVCFCL